MAAVSVFPEERNPSSRSTKPADLVGFIEFGGYRRHYWEGDLARTSGEKVLTTYGLPPGWLKAVKRVSRAKERGQVHTIQSLG